MIFRLKFYIIFGNLKVLVTYDPIRMSILCSFRTTSIFRIFSQLTSRLIELSINLPVYACYACYACYALVHNIGGSVSIAPLAVKIRYFF